MALRLTGRVVGQDKGGADKLRASYGREGVRLPAGRELVAQLERDWDGGNGRAKERLEPGEDWQGGEEAGGASGWAGLGGGKERTQEEP